MGVASLSQILTATFVPVLAKVQDEPQRFRHFIGRINRLTAFILFPFMFGMAVMADTIFHTLFGVKWDGAVLMFQILMVRGAFVVLTSLYNNYVLALGKAAKLVEIEVVKDLTTLGAIAVTLQFGSVEALVWGQLVASAITYLFVLVLTSRSNGYPIVLYLRDNAPYLILTFAICILIYHIGRFGLPAWLLLVVQSVVAIVVYFCVLKLCKSVILQDALDYILRKNK